MIHGFFVPDVQRPKPFVRCMVRIRGICPDYRPVEFLIDTGASATVLHPKDALATFGIDKARLSDETQWGANRERLDGVGGSNWAFPRPAQFAFYDEDEKEFEELDNRILIAQLADTNQNLYSLLGWDVLRYFSFQMALRTNHIVLSRLHRD